jgi:hypothetical protein
MHSIAIGRRTDRVFWGSLGGPGCCTASKTLPVDALGQVEFDHGCDSITRNTKYSGDVFTVVLDSETL